MCNGDPNKEFEKHVQTAVNELRSGQQSNQWYDPENNDCYDAYLQGWRDNQIHD